MNLHRITFRGAGRWGLVALFAAALVGCGGAHKPPAKSDAEAAVKAVKDCLEAWKAGEKPDALAKRKPLIRVADEDWLQGVPLDSYEMVGAVQELGLQIRCTVLLHLKTAEGEVVERQVRYDIGTNPEISVVREDG